MAEAWRSTFRDGFAPQLSTAGLEALRAALLADTPELVQGVTTIPAGVLGLPDYPVEKARVVGYCYWQGDGLETVGEVGARWVDACLACDEVLGEPAACRWFLNWFDETPRDEMRRALLPEVERELARRTAHEPDRHGQLDARAG